MGSKGDSYDNVLVETINGPYKTELIHRRTPRRTKEAVEFESPRGGSLLSMSPVCSRCWNMLL